MSRKKKFAIILFMLIAVGVIFCGVRYLKSQVGLGKNVDDVKEAADIVDNDGNTQDKSVRKTAETKDDTSDDEIDDAADENDSRDSAEKKTLIDPSGITLETRIMTPAGYTRTSEGEGTFAYFLRNYELKPDGSPVVLYNGELKGNQSAQAAVFTMALENVDLQQCADSVIRMYAEYFRATGQDDRITFHFTNGFLADYNSWKQGKRIQVSGNDVSWVQSAGADDSDESFEKYLHQVFNYAGTASMTTEVESANLQDVQVGDVFLKGGSPGHVVMVVDVCQDDQGHKAFLLAQGYMPAQEFHVLKNPKHEDDPWYYVDEVNYPFHTPEYTFEEGSFKRPKY